MNIDEEQKHSSKRGKQVMKWMWDTAAAAHPAIGHRDDQDSTTLCTWFYEFDSRFIQTDQICRQRCGWTTFASFELSF